MNNKLTLVAGVAITSVSLYSTVLTAAQVSGTANANVLAPLTITAGAAMDFGDVSGDFDAATTVDLDPTTGATSSGDGANTGGVTAAGAFTVTGVPSQTYSIDPIADTVLTGGGTDMPLTGLTSDSTGTLSGAGSESFGVGGTLNINANQGVGGYTGTYSVTVNYN